LGITVESLEKFVAYDPTDASELVSPTPLQMIVAEQDAVIPMSLARSGFDRAGEPKEFVALPCSHTAAYGTEPFPPEAADAAIGWYGKHLAPPLSAAEG